MVSLFRIIKLRFSNGIIKYWFMPRYNSLKVHILGLTIAFVFLLIHQGLFTFNATYQAECCRWIVEADYQSLAGANSIVYSLIIILWFALVTYYFSIWAIITLILLLFLSIVPPEYAFLISFKLSAWWYILGYLSGVIFAILYNDILYLYMIIFRENERKLIFAYDPQKKVNIIKSPNREEEVALPDFPDEGRLYNFGPVECARPYTIAILANPRYEKYKSREIVQDPIMKNLDFFLRSVVRALESFHNNEVLGRPEIWSRVRIVTVFDENIGKGLDEVNESKDGFVEQVKSLTAEIDALVIPKYKTSDDILIDNVLNGEINRLGGPIKYSDIDVVFSFTAMPNFTRACAHYSSKDNGDCTENPKSNYKFEREGKVSTTKYIYEDRACSPGKVALNVLGATQKTFIHEFAHAMSHAENGAIVDEYYDEGVLFLDSSGKPEKEKKPISTMFSVNRLNKSAGTVPVPKIFCNYHESSAEKFVYASDRNHPSAQENWSGFYPERKESDVYCTMDRRYGRYQFDKLIADYMYDRLLHKII